MGALKLDHFETPQTSGGCRGHIRKIIHVDMDCFFAAIAMRDNPKLRRMPLAIGGPASSRGVLCTANYVARKFGVRSAMSSAMAAKLCPGLIILPADGPKIREASEAVFDIFSDYTDLVQPLSCDEAYLDVSQVEKCLGSATLMAKEIKQRIYQHTRLSASAGVAPNKFLAKVASEWNKPDGLFTITPEDIPGFLPGLSVACIPGVGKVTQKKMHGLGIRTCGDLQAMSELELAHYFGKFGRHLGQIARGHDDRLVRIERERKSISTEKTYARDLPDLQSLRDEIPLVMEELVYRIRRFQQKYGNDHDIDKIFAKVKFFDFQQSTVERKMSRHFFDPLWKNGVYTDALRDYIDQLLLTGYRRGMRPVRLLGLGVRFAESKGSDQQLLLL